MPAARAHAAAAHSPVAAALPFPAALQPRSYLEKLVGAASPQLLCLWLSCMCTRARLHSKCTTLVEHRGVELKLNARGVAAAAAAALFSVGTICSKCSLSANTHGMAAAAQTDVWVYPRFLNEAASAADPVRRMECVVTWFVAGECVVLPLVLMPHKMPHNMPHEMPHFVRHELGP